MYDIFISESEDIKLDQVCNLLLLTKDELELEQETVEYLNNKGWLALFNEYNELLSENYRDNFKLLDKLGKGGYGKVFLVADTALNGRLVAQKFIMETISDGQDEHKNSFEIEIRVVPEIEEYDHAVTIYSANPENDPPYIISEYMEGGSLRKYLIDKGKLSLKEAISLIAPIAELLGNLDKKELWHRDISPENILLNKDKTVSKLGDFGIAKKGEEKSQLSRNGGIPGKWCYLAPELKTGQKIESYHKCDVYSLAVVLRECLCEKDFLKSKTEIRKNLEENLSDEEKTLREQLEDVLKKALCEDPEERIDGNTFANKLKEVDKDIDPKKALCEDPEERIDGNTFANKLKEVDKDIDPSKPRWIAWVIFSIALLAILFWLIKNQNVTFVVQGDSGQSIENVALSLGSEFVGRPPVEVRLSPGRYTLTGQFPAEECRWAVEVGLWQIASIILNKAQATCAPRGEHRVEITSNSEGKDIYINGINIGQSPIDTTLQNGTYQIGLGCAERGCTQTYQIKADTSIQLEYPVGPEVISGADSLSHEPEEGDTTEIEPVQPPGPVEVKGTFVDAMFDRPLQGVHVSGQFDPVESDSKGAFTIKISAEADSTVIHAYKHRYVQFNGTLPRAGGRIQLTPIDSVRITTHPDSWIEGATITIDSIKPNGKSNTGEGFSLRGPTRLGNDRYLLLPRKSGPRKIRLSNDGVAYCMELEIKGDIDIIHFDTSKSNLKCEN